MISNSINKYILTPVLILCLCLTATGCRKADDEEISIPEQTTSDENLSSKSDFTELPEEQEVDPLLIQASLFIQDGFRTYEIEGTYQLYFAEPTGDDVKYALVYGDKMCWGHFVYSYDEHTDWYTFRSQYEPIFANVNDEDWWQENRKYATSNIEEIVESSAYETEISRYTDIIAARRYNGQNGPVEKDEWIDYWRDGIHYNGDDDITYSVRAKLYTYYDERLDIHITIEYPDVSLYGSYEDDAVLELQSKINEQLKGAAFYGYWSDSYNDGVLHPSGEMYTYIGRQYMITRMDNDYLSMRIYEYNDVRGANHPNEWETGVTVDMHTGEVLTLADVVGEERTMSELIESNAFQCLWEWYDGDPEEEKGKKSEEWLSWVREDVIDDSLSDYDTYFYITDNRLGLVTFMSRYCTCMEAEFEDLGINGF